MTPNYPWRSRGGLLVVKSAPDVPELVLEARQRPVRRLAARSVSAPQNYPPRWVLIPLRAVPGQLGLMPRLVQTLGRLRPPLACPRLPAPRPVAHPVVRHRPQHRLNQPRSLLWHRRLQLRRERRQRLLGPLKADLARL